MVPGHLPALKEEDALPFQIYERSEPSELWVIGCKCMAAEILHVRCAQSWVAFQSSQHAQRWRMRAQRRCYC